jgi:antitoxin FitA
MKVLPMATLVIRNVEDELHLRLKARAAAYSRSMEEEARLLLRQGLVVLPGETRQAFGQAMRAIFEPLGGFEFPEMRRELPKDPPALTRMVRLSE